MSDLECNHCGNIAFTTRDVRDGVPWFTDGDGEKCDHCGMPGHVSVDEPDPDEASVSWVDVQESGVYCERADCEECAELRVEDKTGDPQSGDAGAVRGGPTDG
jgi:hypothetical protein